MGYCIKEILKEIPKEILKETPTVRGGPGNFQSDKNGFVYLETDLDGFRRIWKYQKIA